MARNGDVKENIRTKISKASSVLERLQPICKLRLY